MLKSMNVALTENPDLKTKNIVIGTGMTGVKAFQTPAADNAYQVLLTWQWLDGMESLAKGTVVVLPKHAMDDQVKGISAHVHLIPIEGVLHTINRYSIAGENTSAINDTVTQIVMLGGDAQQTDGSWKLYTVDMAHELLTQIPSGETLILNGPRTGKHLSDKTEDKTAHRTSNDPVTVEAMKMAEKKGNWKVLDFIYGQPSQWKPALKFCVGHPDTVMVLPGESTSMISEALGVGIRPALFKHDAMTATSAQYVDQLVKAGQATLFPELPVKDHRLQTPVEPQEKVVVRELVKLISAK